MKKTLCLCLAGLLAVPALIPADGASVSTGARWLNIQNNPRVAAQGGAGAALDLGAGSLGVNPAGLSGLKDLQVETSHLIWTDDISLERVAVAAPVFGDYGVGLDLDYVNLGTVEAFQVVNGLPQQTANLNPFSGQVGVAIARPLMGDLALGVMLKGVFENLGEQTASTVGGDIGLRWSRGTEGLALGLALSNWGGDLDGAPLPVALRAGASWVQPVAENRKISFGLDLALTPNSDEALALGAGIEYSVAQVADFRAGYIEGGADAPSGPTAGLGLQVAHWLAVDYAFSWLQGLPANQIALRVDWGGEAAQAPLAPSGPAPVKPLADPDAPTPRQVMKKKLDDLIAAVEKKDTASADLITQDLSSQYLSSRQEASKSLAAPLQATVFTGDFEEAERYLKVMTQLDRTDAYAWEALGSVQWFLGKPADALEDYQKSLALDPGRAWLQARIDSLKGPSPSPSLAP